MNMKKFKKYILEPERFTDKITDKSVRFLGKTSPVKKIRRSKIISAIIGVTGFALIIDGVSKMFYFLPGWGAILLGLLFLAVSGAMLRFLTKDANWW